MANAFHMWDQVFSLGDCGLLFCSFATRRMLPATKHLALTLRNVASGVLPGSRKNATPTQLSIPSSTQTMVVALVICSYFGITINSIPLAAPAS